MQIGVHISKSGTLDSWVDNAIERECSAFQVFTRSPRSWFAKELDLDEAKKFREKLEKSDIDRMATCAHMPYLPNLSTPEDEGYEKSIKSMIEEVKRCDKLGIPYLVTHLGSHKGSGEENGIKRLTNALNKVAETKAEPIRPINDPSYIVHFLVHTCITITSHFLVHTCITYMHHHYGSKSPNYGWTIPTHLRDGLRT